MPGQSCPVRPVSWTPNEMKRTAATISLFAVLAACGGDAASFGEPKTLPGDRRPTVWGASARVRLGLPQMGATGGQKQVVATTPSGWEELPPNPQRFRNAVWRVAGQPSTDCYLTIGVGGGVQGNLGRWYRNQFGKTEVPALEALPVVRFADRPGRLAEIEGTFGGKQEQAALIAFFHEGQQVTSLKFTGPVESRAGQPRQVPRAGGVGSPRYAEPEPERTDDPARPTDARGPSCDRRNRRHRGDRRTRQLQPAARACDRRRRRSRRPTPEGWTVKGGSQRTLHHVFGARWFGRGLHQPTRQSG